MYIDSTMSAVRYWLKLQIMKPSRLPNQALCMMMTKMPIYDEEKSNVHNWPQVIKRCLDMFGFSEVWHNGGVGNVGKFLRLFKQRQIDCFKQDWHNGLTTSDRFVTYRSFKTILEPERYLMGITIAKFRQTLTRFRLGINDLNINNRYSTTPTNCPFCNCIESEYHFLFACPEYSIPRGRYVFKHCNFCSTA